MWELTPNLDDGILNPYDCIQVRIEDAIANNDKAPGVCSVTHHLRLSSLPECMMAFFLVQN